ncbi:MDR family MFS transporter [Calidithermus chliarophilus]|uniref:MDR family MFS transporter n=1 Tax=Calidithermus chliarophilus TaxID=52023 RepID=UPI000420C991|nr:MDR family MFS transporter [Calidithermus chliarophilus]
MAAQPTPFKTPELTPQERLFTLLGTLLGLLLAALDQTIVATAGPAIQRDLSIEPSLYVWITTAYLVTSTVFVPIYGKLSDLYGRKPVLIAAISIFLLGSLLCGLAQSAVQLILFRALQGLGSAGLFTTAFAIIADIFPPAVRGRYTGLFGAVFGLSSVVGPLVGGFLTDNISWHWVFFVNLPVGAVALAFIVLRMPLLRLSERRPVIDYLGAAWLLVFTVPLLLALSLGKTQLSPGETGYLWGSWQILGMFALALAGLAGFLLTERRVKEPILPLSLFANRTFAVGNAASFVLGAGFLAAIVFLPLFMVIVVGLSATSSGLTVTPLTFGIVFGNVISGQLVSRIGRYKPLMLAGIVLLATAFTIMGFTLTPDSSQAEVTLKMILMGLGLGPAIPLYTLAIQNAVPPQMTGVASSSALFFRSMGSTIGVAVLGSIFANTFSAELTPRVQAATADLPPALRAQFQFSGNAAGGEGGAQLSFDAEKVKAQIARRFEEQERALRAALEAGDPQAVQKLLADPSTPEELRRALEAGNAGAEVRAAVLAGATRGLEQARQSALATVDRVEAALKQALTTAIRQVYQIGIVIVLLGLAVTLFIPELPLRRSNAPAPAAAD